MAPKGSSRDAGQLRAGLRTVHAYAVTPFRPDDLLSVDHRALSANLTATVDRGVGVIAVGGGTGECEQLSTTELAEIARTAVQAVGDRAIVIAGLPPNMAEAISLATDYEEAGVDMALLVPPLIRWRVPADLEGVAVWIERLASRTSLPLMPYNTQGWTAEFFERLARVDSVVGVKDPCADPLPFFRAIQRLGDRFVWIGNKRHDPGVAHLRYQMGMQGFTSGMANFLPEPEIALHEACAAGNWSRAIRVQSLCAPLEVARNASDDAAVVKAAMDAVGLYGGRVRPPRLDIPAAARDALQLEVAELRAASERGALG
jgi:dihydrodipicolinate synthase/N-acetylneuraminate lyase